MPSARTIQGAIKALDGFAQVVKNEQIVHGIYVADEVERPDLAEAGAICGGRRACAVGSLWIGAGVPIQVGESEWGISTDLEGVHAEDRPAFLARRPALRLAYETLNATAEELWPKQAVAAYKAGWYDEDGPNVGAMEALFESGQLRGRGRPRHDGLAGPGERQKLLDLIAASREKLVTG